MGNAGRWPNLGAVALVLAAGGLLSGLGLALFYAPTLDHARTSVAFLEQQVAWGRFLRALHHWAGNLALAAALLHGLRIFWLGAYKRPRHMVWLYGGGLTLALLGFAYTGYLLAGDERAFTGLGVLSGVAESTPLIGRFLADVVRGGAAVSSVTLVRIYVVHVVVLPAALCGLLWAFLRARRAADPAPVTRFPRDAYAAMAALVLVAALALALPPALGPEPDPSGAGAADARPEWFFLWVNELLHRAPGATFLVAAVLPALLAGLGSVRRKPEIALAAAILAGLVALTALAVARAPAEKPPEPAAGTALPPGADLEERARAVLKSFRCAKCHTIDGDPEGGETGPALDRAEFPILYTREFFRRKVGDPLGFWPDTGMVYKPRSKKPTPEELETLERWFFGAR